MRTQHWAWLTAFTLLFAGLTNAHAHVHYCFDGQEPPASVHIADGLEHHHDRPAGHDYPAGHDHAAGPHDGHHDDGEGDDGSHDDLDLDLPNQAVAKSAKYDLPAIASVWRWTAVIDTERSDATVQHATAPPRPSPSYSRPPLRGPPH